jgi:hypothetical protein
MGRSGWSGRSRAGHGPVSPIKLAKLITGQSSWAPDCPELGSLARQKRHISITLCAARGVSAPTSKVAPAGPVQPTVCKNTCNAQQVCAQRVRCSAMGLAKSRKVCIYYVGAEQMPSRFRHNRGVPHKMGARKSVHSKKFERWDQWLTADEAAELRKAKDRVRKGRTAEAIAIAEADVIRITARAEAARDLQTWNEVEAGSVRRAVVEHAKARLERKRFHKREAVALNKLEDKRNRRSKAITGNSCLYVRELNGTAQITMTMLHYLDDGTLRRMAREYRAGQTPDQIAELERRRDEARAVPLPDPLTCQEQVALAGRPKKYTRCAEPEFGNDLELIRETYTDRRGNRVSNPALADAWKSFRDTWRDASTAETAQKDIAEYDHPQDIRLSPAMVASLSTERNPDEQARRYRTQPNCYAAAPSSAPRSRRIDQRVGASSKAYVQEGPVPGTDPHQPPVYALAA